MGTILMRAHPHFYRGEDVPNVTNKVPTGCLWLDELLDSQRLPTAALHAAAQGNCRIEL